MPKVSIIVPVYNVEKYLEKCLRSLTHQILTDIEIICVNDGSTDSSLEILERFARKDDRVKIINIQNSGQAFARNLGISNAQGEYIGFVDSDDWVDEDFYEKLYDTAKKYEADVACAGYKRFAIMQGITKKKFKKEIFTQNNNLKVELDNIPEQCYVWNKIYKRESWLRAGLSFPQKRIFEDVAVILKLLGELNSMVTVPKTYYHYRRRAKSTVTVKKYIVRDDFDDAYNEMFQYAQQKGINTKLLNTDCRKKFVRIFGIKLLKIKYYPRKIKYLLFGFIPVAVVNVEYV